MKPPRLLLGFLLLFSTHLEPPAAEPGANPAPQRVNEVKNIPLQPRSGEPVAVTAKVGIVAKSVSLEYQIVEPGGYIPLKASGYEKGWATIPMSRAGAGDGVYSAAIPVSVQMNRRLVRYRIKVESGEGKSLMIPPASDPCPNFAYFVYDGVPAWKAAIQPGSADPKQSRVLEFGTNVMGRIQNYFLIARAPEIEDATWRDHSTDKAYKYTGTFVAEGHVYDHVHFRARGGVWRHAMGKNMWKIEFNKGNHFQPRDDYGREYKVKWSKLNLRACIQQGDYDRRGEQGMFESVGFRLFNLAGVESPRTHWISLRIIDEKVENPASQYKGDFWGLYLAIENEDGRFLAEHDLPDGNLYKMMYGGGDLSNHGADQVTNKTDLAQLATGLRRAQQPEAWLETNIDLPRYYSYRSIVEAIHHYDISDGKNYDLYRNPKMGRWQVIPWDIDLTWGDQMYGRGTEPFLRPILSHPAFRLEYQNRLREIRDLLFNPEETGRLIDECAAILTGSSRTASILDADRAKWDYHPIMISPFADASKAGQGLFYRSSRTGDFAGMVRQMKEYVRKRMDFIDASLLEENRSGTVGNHVPATPRIVFTGASGYPVDGLRFKCSPFGDGAFAAMKWRIGEIAASVAAPGKPAQPGVYEITPVWESGELSSFQEEVGVPGGVLKPGHIYRARARMKNTSGAWSHWSAPIEFTTSNK